MNDEKILKELKSSKNLVIDSGDKESYLRVASKSGFLIESQTDYQIIIRAPKKFGWTPFVLLTLIFNIFGMVGYVIYYATKDYGKKKIISFK